MKRAPRSPSSWNRRAFLSATGAAASLTLVSPKTAFGSSANSKVSVGLVGCGHVRWVKVSRKSTTRSNWPMRTLPPWCVGRMGASGTTGKWDLGGLKKPDHWPAGSQAREVLRELDGLGHFKVPLERQVGRPLLDEDQVTRAIRIFVDGVGEAAGLQTGALHVFVGDLASERQTIGADLDAAKNDDHLSGTWVDTGLEGSGGRGFHRGHCDSITGQASVRSMRSFRMSSG